MKTIRIQDMEEQIQYIVVKGTSCRTVQKGDHLRKRANGNIECREAQGWIEGGESIRRWRAMVTLDTDFYTNRIAWAMADIAKSKAILERHAITEDQTP